MLTPEGRAHHWAARARGPVGDGVSSRHCQNGRSLPEPAAGRSARIWTGRVRQPARRRPTCSTSTSPAAGLTATAGPPPRKNGAFSPRRPTLARARLRRRTLRRRLHHPQECGHEANAEIGRDGRGMERINGDGHAQRATHTRCNPAADSGLCRFQGAGQRGRARTVHDTHEGAAQCGGPAGHAGVAAARDDRLAGRAGLARHARARR
jgi:hypothetical protein